MSLTMNKNESEIARQQSRDIIRLREETGVTPVYYGVPEWLRERIITVLKELLPGIWRTTPRSGWSALRAATAHCGADSIIDHAGTAFVDGNEFFATEPYYPSQQLYESAFRFADLLKIEVVSGLPSWHFPGQTERFLFRPKILKIEISRTRLALNVFYGRRKVPGRIV